jgi:hypothetical protein
MTERGKYKHGGYSLWERAYGERRAMIMDVFFNMIASAVDYDPTDEQSVILDSDANPKLIIGGVRAGKSFTTAILVSPYMVVPNGRIWIIGADYTQVAEFDYLLDFAQALGIVDGEPSLPVRGSRSFKVLGGSRIETKSADDLRRIASFSVDAFVAAEVGQMADDILSKGLERTIESDGAIILSGTLENGMPWLSELYHEWLGGKDGAASFSIPTWSNTKIFPDGKDDPKFKVMASHLTEDEFKERFAAVPRKLKGLCHPNFEQEFHVRHVEYPIEDMDNSLQLWIDPGVRTYAALIVRVTNERVWIVDEVYRHDVLTDEMIEIISAKSYYDNIEFIVIDVASRQRHARESVFAQWRRKTNLPVVTRMVGVNDGIDAINRFLMSAEDGLPRLVFSDKLSNRTVNGVPTGILAEIRMRRYATGPTMANEKVVPIKKWDHALNALGYGLFANFQTELEQPVDELRVVKNYTNLGRTK